MLVVNFYFMPNKFILFFIWSLSYLPVWNTPAVSSNFWRKKVIVIHAILRRPKSSNMSIAINVENYDIDLKSNIICYSIWVFKLHHLYMEQYIRFSLIHDLFCRNLGTYQTYSISPIISPLLTDISVVKPL